MFNEIKAASSSRKFLLLKLQATCLKYLGLPLYFSGVVSVVFALNGSFKRRVCSLFGSKTTCQRDVSLCESVTYSLAISHYDYLSVVKCTLKKAIL